MMLMTMGHILHCCCDSYYPDSPRVRLPRGLVGCRVTCLCALLFGYGDLLLFLPAHGPASDPCVVTSNITISCGADLFPGQGLLRAVDSTHFLVLVGV